MIAARPPEDDRSAALRDGGKPIGLARWSRASLRRTLVLALLGGMLVASGAALWSAWRTATRAADAAYDRSLAGAIKAIDANITTAGGGLGVELPYPMLEFFQLTSGGAVYFRVATEDGLVEIGNTDLPAPGPDLPTGRPRFRNASYYGEPIRLGSYARELKPPLAGHEGRPRVVVQVAESMGPRHEFRRALLLEAGARNAALVALALLLMALGIGWALRPLARLSAEVQQREPNDLTPIDETSLPREVRPLVQATNHHMRRHQQASEERRRFVDDASHQLRTPLTTLATQVAFALRETPPGPTHDALTAIREQLDAATRQVNQMLALARADSMELRPEPVDLVALARDLTRQWWPRAREARIDLGFDTSEPTLTMAAQPGLLREALSNLLHNALRYTPAGGHVTVRVAAEAGEARLSVEDDGPGLPPEELARAGERFFRGSGAQAGGSGLGLAIARAVAERHDGHLRVHAGPRGHGFVACLDLPLPPATT